MHTLEEALKIARPGQFIIKMTVGPMARIENSAPGNWLNRCYLVTEDRTLRQVR